ncbi:DUF1127 domain-containing protein [Roseibium aquae]|uniref:DUF1127 domain-containing protein n=1 Tax=Roseibium aquae TaxID=1323746 RepID=A0A916X2K6_9HYPH|nr:DUF1127 domain-containing protein [Roseibium aquae]GGB54146.1 DUF1127 domain-containing protein [Roseibium aquae]
MLDSVVRSFRNWKRYQNTYNELSRLSERELTDLGISRGDIDRYARASMK